MTPTVPITDILACDPGDKPGFAWFHLDGDRPPLLYVSRKIPPLYEVAACGRLLVEFPELRRGVDPRRILKLAYTVGRIAGALPGRTVYRVPPSRWKGSLPKAIHHAQFAPRLRALNIFEVYRFDTAEKLPFSQLTHDERDAIALLFWGIDFPMTAFSEIHRDD